MSSTISWIKTHKLTILLSLIIFFLIFNRGYLNQSNLRSNLLPVTDQLPDSGGGLRMASALPEAAPVTSPADRMVIKSSSLSLLVTKVDEAQKKIVKKAEEVGGYMVRVSLSNPQDAPTATVVVRIPAKDLNTVLDYFRKEAVKVVSENLQGYDVTDQYVDLEARLETLNKTKTKFEQILDRATIITDILEVQRELINLQSQIDAVKGQMEYYEKNAEMSKVTVYLSTDELSLPYVPSESWRPVAIFKQAVRSLVSVIRSIGTIIIWLGVFSVVWVPAFFLIRFIRKKR